MREYTNRNLRRVVANRKRVAGVEFDATRARAFTGLPPKLPSELERVTRDRDRGLHVEYKQHRSRHRDELVVVFVHGVRFYNERFWLCGSNSDF